MTCEDIKNISLCDLISDGGFECECGRRHSSGTKKVIIESGAILKLPEILSELGVQKPFLLSGHDSFAAAGEPVCNALIKAGISFEKYVFPHSPVTPTEHSVGSAVMHFDRSCDCVVGIGSGVINDIGKILAHTSGLPYIIVGTAPSMDGFASATSSMETDGLKVSLESTFATVILGDLDILKNAPMHMLISGVGDMLAKYISLTEWRIAALLVGEYYCPVVAELVSAALDRVVRAAPGLLNRDPEAVKAVMEGMVIGGVAMKYAGLSRPASGMEHYFSHIWDMRSLAFPEARSELHGIQCGIATLYALKAYDYIRTLTPDEQIAKAFAKSFDLAAWNRSLRDFVGPGADAMIKGEEKEGKYDAKKHSARLSDLVRKWPEILKLINGLPSYREVYDLMVSIGAPTSAASFGYRPEDIMTTFTMTKDIRDKYIGTRLLWDLGRLDEAKNTLIFE